MWQVGITILKAETLHNNKFRHQQRIFKSDILLVHCSGQHYVAAGEPSLFLIEPVQCIYFGTPISVNGALVGPSGTPVILLALRLIALYIVTCKIIHSLFWHSGGMSVGGSGAPVSVNGAPVSACH